jgi:DNA polymerase-1
MENEKEHLLIIDSNSIIHRAYHALPRLTTKKGELVNAVYGFLLVFLKAIKDFQPDYIAAAFDFPAPTFRHEKYKEYKAKRPKVPEELYQQISKHHE